MLGTLGMALLGMVLWQTTEPQDISGQWTSDEWGTVVLKAKEPGQYEGTFTRSGNVTNSDADAISSGVAVADFDAVRPSGTSHSISFTCVLVGL